MDKNQHFDLYSRYYDLLYQEKDYKAEADYVSNLMQREYVNPKTILEFGSGTGRHGLLFMNNGYSIYGIEKSASMVEEAKAAGYPCENADITDFSLKRTFDVVLALFHVISYLNENEDVISAFKNASKHLNQGGLFIFDVWYLPAVLMQKPENRLKKVSDDKIEVIRYASPEIHYNRNIVDVNYHLLIKENISNQWQEFWEKHPMRYFSIPEISLFAEVAGFKMIKSEEFLTGNTPSENTWGICFILQKL